MRNRIVFAASVLVLLAACNNDEVLTSLNDEDPQISNEFAISNDEAKDILNFFVNDGASTRSDGKTITIKDYKVRNVEVQTDDNTEIVPVYEYTTVNENGDEGYSIVVGDRRIQKVLVQVDKGTIFDTINNIVLKHYIESIPIKVAYDLNNYLMNNNDTVKLSNQLPTRDFNIITQSCFLPTEWGQDAPYNIACPTSSCGSNNHALTGCVPLAIAQILAYHHVPGNLSWAQILQQTKLTNSTPQIYKEQVANLIYAQWSTLFAYVYYNLDGTCGTSVDLYYMPLVKNVFNSYSLVCSNLKNYNLNDIKFSLDLEYPVFMCGYTSNNGPGHAWVSDGYKVHVYDNDSYNYLHFNWGLDGYSNGYFYAEPGSQSFFLGQNQYNYNIKIITDIH